MQALLAAQDTLQEEEVFGDVADDAEFEGASASPVSLPSVVDEDPLPQPPPMKQTSLRQTLPRPIQSPNMALPPSRKPRPPSVVKNAPHGPPGDFTTRSLPPPNVKPHPNRAQASLPPVHAQNVVDST